MPERPWPRLDEPLLVERLTLGHDAFLGWLATMARALGHRTATPELVERALAYPWARPVRSYVLDAGAVTLLEDLADDDARRRTLTAFTAVGGDDTDRFPLLAFGSNGAPATLTAKFAHFEAPEDRRVLVVAGDLHDFDVGASAQPTVYGSMPATLVPSPGTAVRAAVLWVTQAQFTLLTWTELSYDVGRLANVRFTADEHVSVDADHGDSVLAYVSRFGAFCTDAAHPRPVALAAIPAAGRTAVALTQVELLDAAARLILGPDAGAEQLVRAIFADAADVLGKRGDTLRVRALPFSCAHWRRHPATTLER